MIASTLRPLWFQSPTGVKLYAAAERDSDGWIVRLYDEHGKQISPVAYRVFYETSDEAILAPLSLDIVSDLMNELRRQVMQREMEIVTPSAG